MKNLKNIGVFLIAAIMAVMITLPAHAAEPETTLYEYDAATAGDVWGHFTGNWVYDENGISVTNDGNDVWFYTYMGVEEGWKDYVIEVDLVNVAEGGVIFRCSEPGAGIDAFGGYIIAYDSAYAYVGMDDHDAWKTLPDDGPQAPAAAALGYAPKLHWKIVVKENTFTLYVDDSPVPFIQVQDSTYTEGGIGLRCKVFEGDDSGYFSNLKVYELKEDQTSSTEPGETEPNQNPVTSEPTGTEQTNGNVDPGEENNVGSGWIVGIAVAVVAIAVVLAVAIKKKK